MGKKGMKAEGLKEGKILEMKKKSKEKLNFKYKPS